MHNQEAGSASKRDTGVDLLREVTWLLQYARKNALFLLSGSALFMSIFLGLATGSFQSTCTWVKLAVLEQRLWNYIYDSAGGNEILLFIVGTLIVSNLTFWILNLILLVLDMTGKPQFLLKYKIQQDKNMPLDPGRLKQALRVAFFNLNVVSCPFFFLSYYVGKLRGMTIERELPSVPTVILDLVMFAIVEEIGFYYGHRMLHHKFLYKIIHKKHHEWTAPIGLVSIYAHPVEHILSNLLPIAAGPLIMRSHVVTSWIWTCVALFATIVTHSGYHFPLLPSPEYHDYHHLKFNNCFGVLGILDRLHGTDTMFRQSKQFKHHFTLLSLTPAPKLIQQMEEKEKEE